MGKFRSGIGIIDSLMDGGRVTLGMLPGNDSHPATREALGIRNNDNDLLGRYQTPLEYVPRGALDDFSKYELVFDAGRPDGWTEAHTALAVRQFRDDIEPRIRSGHLEQKGHLDLSTATSIPEDMTIGAGGGMILDGLTTIPKGVTLSVWGDLYLRNVTSISDGVSLRSAAGDIYLDRMRAIPKGVKVKALTVWGLGGMIASG